VFYVLGGQVLRGNAVVDDDLVVSLASDFDVIDDRGVVVDLRRLSGASADLTRMGITEIIRRHKGVAVGAPIWFVRPGGPSEVSSLKTNEPCFALLGRCLSSPLKQPVGFGAGSFLPLTNPLLSELSPYLF
jgi:hypothetical protein